MIRGQWAPCFAALFAMGLALVAGHAGRTVVDLSDLPLTDVPEKLGPWTCTAEEMPEGKNTSETSYLIRTYEREDGTAVQASLEVTASRLGALRNWSIAMMGNGWNVDEPTQMGPIDVDGLPFEMIAKLQWLHRPGRKMLTATWFVSPRGQAIEYERAQMLGWRDRLLGDCIWGEMYLKTLEGESEQQLEQATEDLARRLAPHFHSILAERQT